MNKQHLLILTTLLIGFAGGLLYAEHSTEPMQVSESHDHTRHEHVTMNIPANLPEPSVELEVLQGNDGAWNAHATFDNFTIAPENAGGEAVDGEGHAHIYLDGEKLNRLYGEWYHLGTLEEGEHEVEVWLSSNNHMELAIDDAPIKSTQIITVELE